MRLRRFGLMLKSLYCRDSQSLPALGYSVGFNQSPCSRQTIRIRVSARVQAKAAPEAPAPMIRTSTGSSLDTLDHSFRWPRCALTLTSRAQATSEGCSNEASVSELPAKAIPEFGDQNIDHGLIDRLGEKVTKAVIQVTDRQVAAPRVNDKQIGEWSQFPPVS